MPKIGIWNLFTHDLPEDEKYNSEMKKLSSESYNYLISYHWEAKKNTIKLILKNIKLWGFGHFCLDLSRGQYNSYNESVTVFTKNQYFSREVKTTTTFQMS